LKDAFYSSPIEKCLKAVWAVGRVEDMVFKESVKTLPVLRHSICKVLATKTMQASLY
jgi:hypothetical protein